MLNAERQSTSVVGGPRTGKTSLLRFLASAYADKLLPELPYRVYVDAQVLSSSSRPADFWLHVFRTLRDRLTAEEQLAKLLDEKVADALTRPVDNFDIEDVFDSFGRLNKPVVLLVDGWDRVLRNQNFWGDFFHVVRSMGQRQPRGVGFVLATQRRLLDLSSDEIGSPYYNIFGNVMIGQLEEQEIRSYVGRSLKDVGLAENEEAAQLVLEASDSHPYVMAFVTSLVTDQLQKGGQIVPAVIATALRDPDGPLVSLVRDIRAALSPSERRWLDDLRAAPQQVTQVQRKMLESLRGYGLLPPGTRI
jgi:hypothetical protein